MYDFDHAPVRRGSGSLKWDEVGANELPMWVADMDFFCAPAITDALVARAKHGAYGYAIVPDAWYDAYRDWWRTRHGLSIEREWMQFCTGVVPAISCLVKRLTNIGDNVALLTPVFDIFFHSIENGGRHVAECRLLCENGEWRIDFDALERVLSDPLTKLMIVCNPHNPTGNIWSKEELARIGALCKTYGVTVLSDEIHCDLSSEPYVPYLSAADDPHCVVCISASKAFNLAGLQSAAVVVPDPRLRETVVRGLNADEVAEPNCFAVDATVAALTEGGQWHDELVAYLAENRRTAIAALASTGLVPTGGRATYLAWIDCSRITADGDAFCAYVRKTTGLVVSNGSQYRGGCDAFLRLNLACPRARLRDGLDRLVRAARSYPR